jgi:DNA-binding transcriptional ArsR family regulator
MSNLDNAKIQRLAQIDRVIHEPARLMIVAMLAAVAEADFQYLHQSTGLTKGNLSVHLSRLEEAGYVEIEKTFRGKYPLTICRLTRQGKKVLDAYRKVIRNAL